MAEKGKLYLIPTILAANTEEKALSNELIKFCNTLEHVLAENIRTARRCLAALPEKPNIQGIIFQELNKNTEAQQIDKLMAPVFKGKSVGVMSEAGCPGIADPGAKAVAYAHKNDIQVIPWVGPSSIFLALMGSGFSGQRFTFNGYLPIDKKDRIKAIKQLEQQTIKGTQTQIFMETPYRNNQLLNDIISNCNPNSLLCIASNITSKDELIKTRSMRDWKKHLPDLHKIPTIFLLGTYS